MARLIGAKCKVCRRLGTKLFLKGVRCDTAKCPIEKENRVPGQHGAKRLRLTEYGVHLREVQRAKKMYGLMHRQFRRYFDAAVSQPGNSGEVLMQMLERRLDNVVYRLRMGTSRANARQAILHGHIRVNGRKVTVPSYLVSAGDTIAPAGREKSVKRAKEALQAKKDIEIPSWLKLLEDPPQGTVVVLPTGSELQVPLESQLVVEFMSR